MVNIKNKINDKEYFGIKDRESYSSVSRYSDSPKKYIESKSEDTSYFSLGKLVDFIRTEGEEKAKEVYAVNVLESLTPQLQQYVEYVVNNIIEKDLTDKLKLDIVKNLGILRSSKKQNTILNALLPTEEHINFYYKNKNKKIIPYKMWITALSIIREWRNNEYTKEYTNIVSNGDIEVFDEYPILWEYESIKLKSKLDRFIINHKEKTIIPIDYKTSSDDVHNFISSYWRWKYYYQASMYPQALKYEFPDYKILPFTFIVSSTITNEVAIYKINTEDTTALIHDVELDSGKLIKGWSTLLKEMQEQKKLNDFEYPLDYIKNGFYEIKNFRKIE